MNTDKNIQNAQELLLQLADQMAAAATSFNAHGYDQFIQARDQYKDSIIQILTNFSN